MTCHHCHKRLTRKGARQIDGVVMCAVCMFKRPEPDDDEYIVIPRYPDSVRV